MELKILSVSKSLEPIPNYYYIFANIFLKTTMTIPEDSDILVINEIYDFNKQKIGMAITDILDTKIISNEEGSAIELKIKFHLLTNSPTNDELFLDRMTLEVEYDIQKPDEDLLNIERQVINYVWKKNELIKYLKD